MGAALSLPQAPAFGVGSKADDRFVVSDAQMAEARRRAKERKRWLVGDEARSERQRSREKFKGLRGLHALRAGRRVFSKTLGASPWRGLELDPGDSATPLGPFGARVDGAGPGGVSLVESTLPLRAAAEGEGSRPVDLLLETSGDAFVPRSAPVEIRFSRDLGEGISIGGEGLNVTPAVTEGAGTASLDGSLMWSNIAPDTDFGVTPNVKGFRTYHVLRSQDSPEELRMDLDLPDGSRLRSSESIERPAVEVLRGDEVLATVSAPVAVDAQGQPVDVTLELAGDDLVLRAAHRTGDFAYPILVDPLVEDQQFWNGRCSWDPYNPNCYTPPKDQNGWQFLNSRAGMGSNHVGHLGTGRYLISNSYASNPNLNSYFYAWDYAQWRFQAPGNSRISQSHFNFMSGDVYNADACVAVGVYPESGPPQVQWNSCTNFSNYQLGWSTVPGTPHNLSAFTYYMESTGQRWAHMGFGLMGGAVTFLEDDYNPYFYGSTVTHQDLPTRWTDRATPTATPFVRDDGLGVKTMSVAYTASNGAAAERKPTFANGQNYHCTGDRNNRCPQQLNRPIPYDTNDMAEGDREVRAKGYDVLGRSVTSAPWRIKIDRTPPGLQLSGSLKDRQGTVLPEGSYDLVATATDGSTSSPANQRSGVESVDIFLDGDRVAGDEQDCDQGSCGLTENWTLDTSQVPSGDHTVQVTAVDQLGQDVSSSFTFTTGGCCFETDAPWGTALLSEKIGVADVTRDGRGDFVTRDPLTGAFHVRASTGTSFSSAVEWSPMSTLSSAESLQLADIDGDGFADLIGRQPGNGDVLVARSTGSEFASPTTWASWPASRTVQFADLDGNNTADLVGVDSADSAVYAKYSEAGVADPEEKLTASVTVAPSATAVFGDIDGDAAADLLIQDGASVRTSLYADGLYEATTTQPATSSSHLLQLADANGDGLADILDLDTVIGDVDIRRATGEGAFAASAEAGSLPSGYAMDAADVDGDVRADLVGFQALTGDIRVATSRMATPVAPAEPPFSPDPSVVYDTEDGMAEATPDPVDPPDVPSGDPIASASAAPKMRLAFQDERLLTQRLGIVGANGPMSQDEAYGSRKAEADVALGKVYTRLREAGGNNPKANPIIRFMVYWGRHENRQLPGGGYPGNDRYFTSRLMADVDLARSKGFSVYFTITGAAIPGECQPGYNANGIACNGTDPPTPTGLGLISSDVPQFAAFAGEIADRFEGKVSTFGIWNEPNNPHFLTSTTGKLPTTAYRQLYTSAYAAIKAQQSAARVFLGELAFIGTRDKLAACGACPRRPFLFPSEFLERVLTRNSASEARVITHGVAWHPYQHRGTPSGPGKNTGEHGIGKLPTILSEITRLYKKHVFGKRLLTTPKGKAPALYITEFGYFNQRPEFGASVSDKWQTEGLKASWLKIALGNAKKAKARWMLLYQATEAPPAPAAAGDPPQYQGNENPASGNYGRKPFSDYGLFTKLGQVVGTRPYGKDPSGADFSRAAYPQGRSAFCTVYRWAKGNGYHATPLPSSDLDGPGGDPENGSCP